MSLRDPKDDPEFDRKLTRAFDTSILIALVAILLTWAFNLWTF